MARVATTNARVQVDMLHHVHKPIANSPNWPCTRCGYNLVGLVPCDGKIRCPECGCVTDHDAILRDLQNRDRQTTHDAIAMVIIVSLVAGVMLFQKMSASVDPISIVLFIMGVAITGVFALWFWTWGLPISRNALIVFAAGMILLLFLPDIQAGAYSLNGQLIRAWIALFLILAFLRAWRRIGDRY